MVDFNKIRQNYKPDVIKILLVAESPPKNYSFFYSDGILYQNLFTSTMKVIFSEFEIEYSVKDSGLKKKLKIEYLYKLKEKGFYLIDAYDKPLNHLPENERIKLIKANLYNKIAEIESLISLDTPIILIKKSVFQVFQSELKKRGYKVNDKYIPFPSHGWQREYEERLKHWLSFFQNLKNT